jgi:hypothetical protein
VPTKRPRKSGQLAWRPRTTATPYDTTHSIIPLPNPQPERRKFWPRRSSRLAKAPTDFPMYPELPAELATAIWDFLLSPRLIYLRNRRALGEDVVDVCQNTHPAPWCSLDPWAFRVFNSRYNLRFPQLNPLNEAIRQPFSPSRDIVVFEPCCSGCRGFYCATRSYLKEDLCTVTRLAFQTDSPNLILDAMPAASYPSMSLNRIHYSLHRPR